MKYKLILLTLIIMLIISSFKLLSYSGYGEPSKMDFLPLQQITGRVSKAEILTKINIPLFKDTVVLKKERTDSWSVFEWVRFEKRVKSSAGKTDTTYYFGWGGDTWQNYLKDITFLGKNSRQDSVLEFTFTELGWVLSGRTYYYYNSHSKPLEKVHEWIEDGLIINDYRVNYSYDNSERLTERVSQVWDPENEEWVYDEKVTRTYGGNGLVQQQNTFHWEGEMWSEPTRIIYTYDENDLLVEYIEDRLVGFSWRKISAAGFTYNEVNELKEAVYKEWQDEKWINDRKTVFEYENGDILIKELGFTWVKADEEWRPASEILFARNEQQNTVTETETHYIPVDWEKLLQKRYIHNEDALVAEVYLDVAENNEYKNGARKYFIFDDNNNISEIIEQNFENGGWVNFERRVLQYDNQNRISEDKYYNWTNEAWVPSRLSEMTYNEEGYKESELIKIYISNQWNTAGKITFEYNEDGLIVERAVYYYKGNEFILNSRVLITYTSFHEPETESLQLYDEGTWYDYSIKYHRFDPENRLVETQWDYMDFDKDKWKTVYLDTYGYDENGRMSIFLEQFYDSGSLVNDKITYYIYDHIADVDETEFVRKDFFIYPNPVKNIVNINLNGAFTGVLSLLDLKGNILGRFDTNGKSLISIGTEDLSAGIYFLHIKSGKNTTAKPFVISR